MYPLKAVWNKCEIMNWLSTVWLCSVAKSEHSSCSTFLVCQTSPSMCRCRQTNTRAHAQTMFWFLTEEKKIAVSYSCDSHWAVNQWSNSLCHLCSWWEQFRSHHFQQGRVDIFSTKHAIVWSDLCQALSLCVSLSVAVHTHFSSLFC